MVNSGVVAAIHVLGVRCDPCGTAFEVLTVVRIHNVV